MRWPRADQRAHNNSSIRKKPRGEHVRQHLPSHLCSRLCTRKHENWVSNHLENGLLVFDEGLKGGRRFVGDLLGLHLQGARLDCCGERLLGNILQ